jgi:hypothetical protein
MRNCDDGDTRGRRHLLEGISSPYSPHPIPGTRRNLWSSCWIRQWWRFGVIPSLEALLRLSRESQDGGWSQRWLLPRAWVFRALCNPCRNLLDVASSRSGQVLPLSCLLLGGLYVGCTSIKLESFWVILLWLWHGFETLFPLPRAMLASGWARRVLVCACLVGHKASCVRFSVWFSS